MKTIMRSSGQALPILVALIFTLGIGLSTVFAHESPKEITGFSFIDQPSNLPGNCD